MSNPPNRFVSIWRSYRSLPAWVQLWVGVILVPVNASGFFFLDTFSGRWIALAALLVMASNGPLAWYYRGMNKALSIPHLLIWLPLNLILAGRLAGSFGTGSASAGEVALILSVLVANSLSLFFDIRDTWLWVRGDRDTPGVGKA